MENKAVGFFHSPTFGISNPIKGLLFLYLILSFLFLNPQSFFFFSSLHTLTAGCLFCDMLHPRKAATLRHQKYQPLQQDEADDELDYEEWSDLAQHPNSVLVINSISGSDQDSYTTAVLPQPIFKNSNANDSGDNCDGLSSPAIHNLPQQHSSSLTTSAPNSSFLQNDSLTKLPQATRDFFHNKWLPSKANRATLANMPPTIVYDIQQGNIPSHADPTLRELDLRGWTIAHRRLYRTRKQKKRTKKKKKSKRIPDREIGTTTGGGGDGDTTEDDEQYSYLDPLQPSNQLCGSIFIKTEYDAYFPVACNVRTTSFYKGILYMHTHHFVT
jgi:hypothetical protein